MPIKDIQIAIDGINKKIDQKIGKKTSDVEGVKKVLNDVKGKVEEVVNYVQSAGKAINLLSKQIKNQEMILSSIVGFLSG